jgi:tellurite resistance protein
MDQTAVALHMLAALAHVAWADGALLPGEARFFTEVIDGLALDPADAARAWRLVVSPPRGPEALPPAPLSPADQRQVLRLGYAMAGADGAVSEVELAALRAISVAYGIPWPEALDLVGHPIAF